MVRPLPEPGPDNLGEIDLTRPLSVLNRVAPVPTPPSRFGIGAVLVEDVARRDANCKVYIHPDGRTRTAIIGRDLHVRQDDGTWADIDLALTPVQVGRGTSARQVRVTRAPCPVLIDGARVQVTDDSGRGIRYTLPTPPVVSQDAVMWNDQESGVTWTYRPTPRGLKASARIATRLGQRSFTFSYQLLGNAAPLTVGADGALHSDAFCLPPPRATGSDGVDYLVGAWQVTASEIVLAYDDTAVPDAAFPLDLDPTTTFSIGDGADDGLTQCTGSTYPPTGSISVNTTYDMPYCTRSFANPNYVVAVALLRFNTASLSGMILQSATLKLFPGGGYDNDLRQVQIEWYNWTPPLSTAHYTATPANNAHAGTSLSSVIGAGQYVSFALQNLQNLNTAGYTGFRLHVSGGQPSSSNTFSFRSYENANNTPPLLEVKYVVPVQLSGTAGGITITGAAKLTWRVNLIGSAACSTTTGAATLTRKLDLAGSAACGTATGAADLMVGTVAVPAVGRTTTGPAALVLSPLALATAYGAAGRTTVSRASLASPTDLLSVAVLGTHRPALRVLGTHRSALRVRGTQQPMLLVRSGTKPSD